jgi:uncharacterized protein (TIGR02147 family)
MKQTEQPSVFDFFSYREYLQSYFAWRKQHDADFSHRVFLREAGIEGSAYCIRIINGSRKLSKSYIPNFLKALKLKKMESHYFTCLVYFCNEKKPDKKTLLLNQILSIRSSRGETTLEDRKSRYFSRWYYPVIRNLVELVDFKEDYHKLSRMLVPPVKPSQARGAVKYLLENNFIKKTPDDRYAVAQEVVSTPPVVHSTVLTQFHAKNLELNLDAFETLAAEDRPYSSVTLALGKKGFAKVREEIRLFRQRLLAQQWDEPGEADRVCHVGFQLLPRARVKKGRK